MSNYSKIVNVVITSDSRGVTVKSFGVPEVIGYHTNWYDTYKVYSLGTIAADLVADGFTTYDPIYRSCMSLARNTPKTKEVVVGRLLTAFTQQFKITVLTAAAEEGRTLAFTLIAPDGSETAISYTVQAADTPTLVATSIASAITAVADITAASSAAVITVDADNAGEMWRVKGLDIALFGFEDATADSNLAAEETTINKAYSNTYGVLLADPVSNARATALAAHVETYERIFGYTTHDTSVGDSASTTDVMYMLKNAQYFRTFGFYSGDQEADAAATAMGNRFPIAAGSSTWAFKTLSGVSADDLETTFANAIEAKNGNYYTSDLGVWNGKVAAGEWIDVIRGRDWNTARLRERIVGLLRASPKIPGTQPGAEAIGAQVEAQMAEGVARTYFAADPAPVVTIPDVTDTSQVTTQNKADRTLPGVGFEAVLAGAIHIVDPLTGIIRN